MQCYEDECCSGCFFDCSCCLKTWKEFNLLGWYCRCSCDKRKFSGDHDDDASATGSKTGLLGVGGGKSNGGSTLNPMAMMDDRRCEWKETQTELNMLLGGDVHKYDGSRDHTDEATVLAKQKLDFEAEMGRQRVELEGERKRLQEERKRSMLERDQADSRKKEADDASYAKQRAEFNAEMARQRAVLDAERKRLQDERNSSLRDLEEATNKRLEAERAAEDAELKRREASAGMLFQKAMSRQTLNAAQQKKEEAEAAERLAENLTREAEEKRRLAEEEEVQHREEIAAMQAMKEELDQSMTEPLEFVMNKAELSADGLEMCRKIVPVLLRNPSMPICIDGHTNCFLEKCKDHCLHVHLSQQRVDAVKEQLKAGGAHNNIITKGWGCKHPELKNVRAVRIYPAPKTLVKISKMTSL